MARDFGEPDPLKVLSNQVSVDRGVELPDGSCRIFTAAQSETVLGSSSTEPSTLDGMPTLISSQAGCSEDPQVLANGPRSAVDLV